MENSKLFTSLNNKKGILLETEEGNLNVSIWKKETPVSITLDKDSAIEICEFITSNLRTPINEEENQRQIDFWAKTVKDAKNWKPSEDDSLRLEGGEDTKEVRNQQSNEEESWENEGGGNAEEQ